MKVTFGNNNKPDFSQINNCPVYLEASTGGVLRNFAKLTGKQLCQSLYFNKVAGLNNFSYRTPLVAPSVLFALRLAKYSFFLFFSSCI